MAYFLLIIIGVLIIVIALTFMNKYLPRWFCDKMGWHLAPKEQKSDGCSSYGFCPRCSKFVLQDSQGNWF